jgi:hypothetical protein
LWIPYSFAPVAERCGSDIPCKVRRAHLKGTKPQGKRGKQHVPKEVWSYSMRRIRWRMSDGYSSTYTLHNRLRQDSFEFFHDLGKWLSLKNSKSHIGLLCGFV